MSNETSRKIEFISRLNSLENTDVQVEYRSYHDFTIWIKFTGILVYDYANSRKGYWYIVDCNTRKRIAHFSINSVMSVDLTATMPEVKLAH